MKKWLDTLAGLWAAIGENVTFLLMCLGIAAALVLVAKLAEHYLLARRSVTVAKRVSVIGVCSAIAAVLHMLDFPLLFLAPEFYKLDFSELPVMLCGFYLGPSAAVTCEFIKILLKLVFKGTSTAFIGDFANFVVGCSLVLPAAIIYHLKRTKRTAIAGLITGTLCISVFGSAFNAVYLLPAFAKFYGMPMEAILSAGAAINSGITGISTFVLLAVAPLNLIKGSVISLLTLVLYKRVARPLFGK